MRAARRSGTANTKTKAEVDALRCEAVASKGHRARPRRLRFIASVARWWCRFWTQAAGLLEESLEIGASSRLPKALSERINAGDMLTVDKFAVTEMKTKEFVALLKKATDADQGAAHFGFVRRKDLYLGAQCETGHAGQRATDVNTEQLLSFTRF